jgi:hypothetical protein
MGGRLINSAGNRRGSGADRLNTVCRSPLEAQAEWRRQQLALIQDTGL